MPNREIEKIKKQQNIRRKRAIMKRRILIIAMLLVVVGVVAIIAQVVKRSAGEGMPQENATNLEDINNLTQGTTDEELVIEYIEPEPEPIRFTVSVAGDCTLGTDTSFGTEGVFTTEYDNQYPAYFMENVKSVFDNDDLTIVNLEGPLTTGSNKADKTFAFKGDPSYTEIMTSGGIEVAGLANNHSYDYGVEGFEDTKNYLTEVGMTWYGYDETPVMDINGIKVGLVGMYLLRLTEEDAKDALITRINQVKEAGAEVILVSYHGGIERDYVPTAFQVELSKLAIDEGADLVFGHHPHVLQGIEEYQGKYIVYSLGNFCFGGNRNPSDKDTMIFQQTFTVLDGEVLVNDEINIIPSSISSTTSRNNYQPTPLTGDEKSRVADKINEISMFDIMPYIE